MALVNCPECGRENISDTAEQCPACGYSVKKHFDKEKAKKIEEQKKQREAANFQEQIDKLQAEREKELQKIDELPYPQQPSLSSVLTKGNIMVIICFFIGLFGIVIGFTEPKLWWFLLYGFFLIVGLLGIWGTWDELKTAKKLYEEQISDWEGYKKKLKADITKRYSEYAKNMAKYGNRYGKVESPLNNSLFSCSACHKQISKQAETCPHCGQPTGVHVCPKCKSTNTKVISGASKAASVAAWGALAANKVTSNYQCNKCGHKF